MMKFQVEKENNKEIKYLIWCIIKIKYIIYTGEIV